MVCKTRFRGSCGNSPAQDQRSELKPCRNNFKNKEKAISPGPQPTTTQLKVPQAQETAPTVS